MRWSQRPTRLTRYADLQSQALLKINVISSHLKVHFENCTPGNRKTMMLLQWHLRYGLIWDKEDGWAKVNRAHSQVRLSYLCRHQWESKTSQTHFQSIRRGSWGMLCENWKLTILGEVEGLETAQHLWGAWGFSDFCGTLGAVQSPTPLEAYRAGETAKAPKEMTWGFRERFRKWSFRICNTLGDTQPEKFNSLLFTFALFRDMTHCKKCI